MARKEAAHLGDGVYAQPGSYEGEVVLTTGSHVVGEAGNVIYLDPDLVKRLQTWLAPAAVWPETPETPEPTDQS
jgi:hypothetical protein